LYVLYTYKIHIKINLTGEKNDYIK